VISKANTAWSKPKGCKDQVGLPACGITLHVFTTTQIVACNNGRTDAVCSAAQDFCNTEIVVPLGGEWDFYYVPSRSPDPYPPPLDNYLHDPIVTSRIGAEVEWTEVSLTVYENFAKEGDWMRTSIHLLENVINAGVRVHLYNGDADFIVNFKGFEAMVRAISYPHYLSFVPSP
jgi:hypothetical protein